MILMGIKSPTKIIIVKFITLWLRYESGARLVVYSRNSSLLLEIMQTNYLYD